MAILQRLMLALAVTLFAGMALAQSEYRVRSGDTLAVEVLEDTSLNRSVVVLPDGRISFPFAGTIEVAGRTVGQIEAAITSGIAGNFAREPNVFVSVQPAERIATGPAAATPTIKIYFMGEVNSPGLKEVEPGTTLLQALAQSGGLTRFAATKRVQMRRTDPRTGRQSVSVIDYRALSNGAALMNDFRVQDGDVILVPERRLFE